MSVVCVASAHGSPGVTTTAVALAGVWPQERTSLLVEADPSGGVLAARFGLADTPGLVSLAATTRRNSVDTEMVWRHAQQLSGGVAVLVESSSGDQARAVIADIADPFMTWASSVPDVDVIVDCGRLTADPAHLALLRGADTVWVAVRPSVDQLRPAFHRLAALESVGVDADLVLVGDSPYGPSEVESALGVTVAGVVAWDPPAATALTGTGTSGGKLGRTLLVRSVAALADFLPRDTAGAPAMGVGS